MYGDGPPGSQPSTSAPAHAASSAAAEAPAPCGANDMETLAGLDRPRRPGRLQAGTDLGGPADAHARSASTTCASSISRAASALAALVLAAVTGPQEAPHDGSPDARNRDIHQADGLGVRAPIGSGDARHGDREVAPKQLARPFGHRDRDLGRYRAVRLEHLRRHPELVALDVVGVGDDAATDVPRGSGHLRQEMCDEAAGTGFRGRDRQATRKAPGLEALDEIDERVGHVRSDWC